jgi:phosphotransferase system HPr (HPr) family protein
MPAIEITIHHEAGLHLRPAAVFVQTAAKYDASIQVQNLSKETGTQDAKSAMGVMLLKVSKGDKIRISAEGQDAQAALDGLKQLIDSDFEAAE